MLSTRDEDVTGGWIDAKIIPAALSAESDLCANVYPAVLEAAFDT